MRKLAAAILWPALAGAAIRNVTVDGTTSTQAVLRYTAPNGGACTVQVSESATLQPLVHDVDPVLFPGENLDTRAESVASGANRVFVVGKRRADRGSDGHWYSRALQAYTVHYYVIACGADQASGTFTTTNITLGNTYNEDLPANPNPASYYVTNGQYAWPEFTNWTDRTQAVIDPQTGMLLKRVTMPQDQPTTNVPGGDHTFSQVGNASGNWTNANNALANDSSFASYTGSTSDWLALMDLNLTDGNGYPVDSATLSVLGWCSGGTCAGTNANIQVCLTVNGVNCWPTNASANILSATLGTTAQTSTFVTVGTSTPMLASWTPAGVNPLTMTDLMQRWGNVNVDAAGNVTWTGGLYFYPNWAAGSLITIGSAVCTVAGSVTTTTLAITPASCSPALTLPVTGAAYKADNFGFLVRKQTASTDTINLQYAKYTLTTELYISWPASGSPDVCSDTLTLNTATGGLGYHCIVSGGVPMVYWIDHTTGAANYLGPAHYPGQGGTNGWQSGYCNNASTTLVGTTATAPEALYCTGFDLLNNEIIVGCTMSSNNTAGNLSFTCANLTPNTKSADLLSLIANYTAGYTPAFSRTVFAQGCGISGAQSGNLVMNCVESQQDTLGWVVVFNPTLVSNAAGCVGGGLPGCVVAAQSTWATAPCRWCVLHTLFQSGQHSNMAWVAGKFMGTTPGQGGGGLYTSTVTAGTLKSTPAIAAGTGACPSGSAGCDQVTVDGEPCNANPVSPDTLGCPKNAAWGYLQPVAVGDLITVSSNTSPVELMKVVAKSGNTWTLQRAYPSAGYLTSPQSYTGTMVLQPNCGAAAPYAGFSWTWDYVNDPHGLNPGGATIAVAYYYDHPTPRPAMVVGADGWNGNTTDPSDGGYAVLNGSGMGFPNTYGSISPRFAGVKGVTQYIEASQDHASASQDAAPGPWFNDARPAGTLVGLDGTATPVAGQLYKYTSATTDGDNLNTIGGAQNANGLNRKLQATMAFCSTQPLADISSPALGNTIGTDSGNLYQYCVARKAGECRTGSAQGDIYMNCPYATPLSGTSYGCFYQNDLCVFNTGAYLNAIAQVGYAETDPAGLLARTVTKGLIRQRALDVNQNVRVLPDASWLLFRTVAVNGAEDAIVVGKLPPYPPVDSASRNTFVPVTVNLKPPAKLGATNAIVEFGYLENGDASNFFCTSRRDVCVAASATVGTVPFLFASEGTGGVESGLTGVACASGCTVSIPGLPQRVLYYRVKYRNAGNLVVAQTGLQVAVTP